MEIREGTAGDLILQWVKRAAFRWPLLRDLSRPRYGYNIVPSQLSWLCDAIAATSSNADGCIVEVGCARGMTTTFLLTHMNNIGDKRPYICLDTFAGFTQADIQYEVNQRGKRVQDYRGFSYNDAAIFHRNIEKCGYPNHRTIQADAASFDWTRIPPIDVMLLDVDLYAPTKAALENSISRWSADARIMVDDVASDHIYDGAGSAYREFCAAHGFVPTMVGAKGGVVLARRKAS
jgi:O-methyltransferase